MPEHVLIIDDEPGLIAAWRFRLEAVGYEVCTASSGNAGLAAAREHKPDMILLDVRMPDMDGFEVCRRLRLAPETQGTPVIFMTANAVDHCHDEAISAGGNGFLPKPCEAATVISAMQNLSGGGCYGADNQENTNAA